MDLKCTVAGSGGCYYPDHLPVLGAPFVPSPPPKPQEFSSGDRVRVQLELEVFKMMQEGHGGWNDQMTEALSKLAQ